MSDEGGHCRHCLGDCIPRGDWDHWSNVHDADNSGWVEPSSAWKNGFCPACAESLDVINRLREGLRAAADGHVSQDYIRGWRAATRVAQT